ncbi:two-component sensor histidine kinase [Marinicauda salina]|uniref:histidine kinase n=1 Tax=Marinicauda salina TaxID=2135793 RepID=A0A2U2BRP8_9PROT|nr:ATP-binding protein [Marinicauda salina]PWE16690.1 two-component sensor histidine kinase [Marinicauda salina]
MSRLRLGIKRYLPKGLFARSLLIIVLPVALMQIAVTWAFFEQHWETVTARLSEGVAGDVAMVVELYEQGGPEQFDAVASTAFNTMGLSVDLREYERLPTTRRTAFFRTLDRTLRRALAANVDHEFWFDTTRYPEYVDIRVEVDEGVLRFIAVREQVFATTGHIFILWMVVATSLLTALSIVFIRNQVKPIRRLAEAAEAFGRGQDVPSFKPAGAREVRQAAHAFLDMRNRLTRHMEQRTALLAGVSHDLRTPLTRLRLQLALMPESEEREAARRDLDDMEAALEEYLSFARGQAAEETAPVDIAGLCRAVAEDAARDGAEIDTEIGDDLVVDGREASIKRALANLVQNAASHADTVRLSAWSADDRVYVAVDDDGPGIPEDQREEAFKPFSRLDESRNANRKGVGLGLAIARDAARAHGGELGLEDSEMGGLRAVMRLPA